MTGDCANGCLFSRYSNSRCSGFSSNRPAVTLYVGRIDGEPVGVSMMFLSSGVAGLYQVEVLPEHRRRGIGTALTLASMEDARQQGYRIAVLQASAMGEPVYRKIGFKSYFRYNYCHPRGCTFADYIAA